MPGGSNREKGLTGKQTDSKLSVIRFSKFSHGLVVNLYRVLGLSCA